MSKYRTVADRASTVFQTLKNLEAQVQAAELEQVGQGKKPEDTMGAGPTGEPMSYSERIAQLNKQIDAVEKANPDLMKMVKTLADREAEQQRQALEG